MNDSLYDRIATRVNHLTATGQAAACAATIIIVWFLAGFHFGFLNDIYQLVINTFTTIVTFQMCFFIQNAQMQDTKHIMRELDMVLDNQSMHGERLKKIAEKLGV